MSKILYEQLLNSGDLRGIEGVDVVIKMVQNQADFDILFSCLKTRNRLIVERTADAIEKITRVNPDYLSKHKNSIINYCRIAQNKELKWHLSQLLPRLLLDNAEFREMSQLLEEWVRDRNESKICRVNALQSLFDLSVLHKKSQEHFILLMDVLENEDIPSLNARIRILRTKLKRTA
ncbi:MAG: hypothetical protein ACKOXF_08640 [Chitinophagaceae bacterium]